MKNNLQILTELLFKWLTCGQICWVILIKEWSEIRNESRYYYGTDAYRNDFDLLIMILKWNERDAVTSTADRWNRCWIYRRLFSSCSHSCFHYWGSHNPLIEKHRPSNCNRKKLLAIILKSASNILPLYSLLIDKISEANSVININHNFPVFNNFTIRNYKIRNLTKRILVTMNTNLH